MVFADELSIKRPVTNWRILEESLVMIEGEFAGGRITLEIREPNGVVRIARVLDAPGEAPASTRSPCRWRLEGGTAETSVTVAGVAASLFPHPRIRMSLAADVGEDEDVREVA